MPGRLESPALVGQPAEALIFLDEMNSRHIQNTLESSEGLRWLPRTSRDMGGSFGTPLTTRRAPE